MIVSFFLSLFISSFVYLCDDDNGWYWSGMTHNHTQYRQFGHLLNHSWSHAHSQTAGIKETARDTCKERGWEIIIFRLSEKCPWRTPWWDYHSNNSLLFSLNLKDYSISKYFKSEALCMWVAPMQFGNSVITCETQHC